MRPALALSRIRDEEDTMQYDSKTRTLTLGTKACRHCAHQDPPGTMPKLVDCPACRGTGNGPRGGRGGCRSCHGSGHTVDHEQRVVCPSCDGFPEDADEETWCDDAPGECVADIPLIVVRQDREASWNEGYLGMGCLWSCTDYGDAWRADDPLALMSRIRDEISRPSHRVQAVKIVRDAYVVTPRARCRKDWTYGDVGSTCEDCGQVREPTTWTNKVDKTGPVPVADAIAIVVTRGGYSLRAVWQDTFDRTLSLAAAERGYHDAMAFGMAVFHAGGNGTLAAALPDPSRIRDNG